MNKRFLPGALKNTLIKKKNVPCKRRASQGPIEPMPVYFMVIDKRSAIVVGPTANVLNVVAAEADRGCPAPTLPSCARRRAAPGLRDLNGREAQTASEYLCGRTALCVSRASALPLVCVTGVLALKT